MLKEVKKSSGAALEDKEQHLASDEGKDSPKRPSMVSKPFVFNCWNL